MKVNIDFEVDLPDEFIIEKEQEFEFAHDIIIYKKLVGKDCSIVYSKTLNNKEIVLITFQEAARDYFLAKNNDSIMSWVV